MSEFLSYTLMNTKYDEINYFIFCHFLIKRISEKNWLDDVLNLTYAIINCSKSKFNFFCGVYKKLFVAAVVQKK